ncbi:hypothetical protein [Neptunitalea lumnitzerae]|uniref:Uncharacterized protein n=1 Tax=Neptunitalea lumnitzerae TaxID=2965509 RepID=A0ABQ5MH45_9FLAO|nr:hypothetical protein [Neptunitalea sp. Y10]GLB48350.1 hypothetical protein Y10_07180 [Neptunitalea sp. Y10]
MNNTLFLITAIFYMLLDCGYAQKTPDEIIPKSSNDLIEELDNNKVVYHDNDLYYLKGLKELVALSNAEGLTIPNVQFYNKDGFFVSNVWSKGECTQVKNEIDAINTQPYTEDKTIAFWLDKIQAFQIAEQPEGMDKIYDGYIVISWANWDFLKPKLMRRLNKQSFEWYEQLKDIPNMKVIFLSIDVMEEWGLSETELTKLRAAIN